MKKFLILLCVMPFLFYSCDEGEDCDTSKISPVTNKVQVSIYVEASGHGVIGYPVKAVFQKFWCDGDFAIQVQYTGYTDTTGVWKISSPEYTLDNEGDYIMLDLYAGYLYEEYWSKKVTYQSDFNVSHTFY